MSFDLKIRALGVSVGVVDKAISIAFLIMVNLLAGCAYRFGYAERELPGSYVQIAIPVFGNQTNETGAEVYFTNALIREFERSRVARVIDKSAAPVVLEGQVATIHYKPVAGVTGGTGSEVADLPTGAVLTTEYRIEVTARLKLRRVSDNKILWEGTFENERVYSAPRVGTPDLNSANSLYNQSIRMQSIARLADDMMEEAHSRITENF